MLPYCAHERAGRASPQPGTAAPSPRRELRDAPPARSGKLTRLRGGESLPSAKICSPQVIADAQCVLEAGNFVLTYLSPDTMVDAMFTLRKPNDRSLATYLATFVGQHGFSWMIISGIDAGEGGTFITSEGESLRNQL